MRIRRSRPARPLLARRRRLTMSPPHPSPSPAAAGRQSMTPPRTAPPEVMHVVWITAGLSCDGDTIAITAATNPSVEDLVLGLIPDLPRVRMHNPVLAYENGDDYLKT